MISLGAETTFTDLAEAEKEENSCPPERNEERCTGPEPAGPAPGLRPPPEPYWAADIRAGRPGRPPDPHPGEL